MDIKGSAVNWQKMQDIRTDFCTKVEALGPDYAAICAISSREHESGVVSDVGTIDPERAHQLVLEILDLLRRQHNWSDEEVALLLSKVSMEVGQREKAEHAN